MLGLMRRSSLLVIVFLFTLPVSVTAWGADIPGRSLIKGNAHAIDGDTLSVDGGPVRLMGIDAPDLDQICLNRYESPFDCGAIAKAALEALVSGKRVECVVADHDRNGMAEGECRADGVDLGGAMVSRGWAFAYRSLSHAYSNAEAYAQSKRLGIWSGKFERPVQWRSRALARDGKINR